MNADTGVRVALLTAGRDKPYALGLAGALVERGLSFDFIGSDAVDGRVLDAPHLITVFNLRGDQTVKVSLLRKIARVLSYYRRLMTYAASERSNVLHILWNNKFELFDRTALMLYYRLLGKRIVLTAHNVNVGKRDGTDSLLNRLSLRMQYRLSHHIFVHAPRMIAELGRDFGVSRDKVTLIPFGVNNTVPKTGLTPAEAKHRLGIDSRHRAMLFFGNIAPYKGLSFLVAAMADLTNERSDYRLIIAGQPKGNESHWEAIRSEIDRRGLGKLVTDRISYIPDEEVELYFKAADVLVLPYARIFQSGVLFLGYNFGLPVVATDVGALGDDVVEGVTGLLCRPEDSDDLARALRTYFESPQYRDLDRQRCVIEKFASQRYSWSKVGEITEGVYRQLLAGR